MASQSDIWLVGIKNFKVSAVVSKVSGEKSWQKTLHHNFFLNSESSSKEFLQKLELLKLSCVPYCTLNDLLDNFQNKVEECFHLSFFK
jgi:hypothetical protein